MKLLKTVAVCCVVGFTALLVMAFRPDSSQFNANQFGLGTTTINIVNGVLLTNAVGWATPGASIVLATNAAGQAIVWNGTTLTQIGGTNTAWYTFLTALQGQFGVTNQGQSTLNTNGIAFQPSTNSPGAVFAVVGTDSNYTALVTTTNYTARFANGVIDTNLTVNGTENVAAANLTNVTVIGPLTLNSNITSTSGTRTFTHDQNHTIITNTATLTASEWTSGSQFEWYNGTKTITIGKTNGTIIAAGSISDSGETNSSTTANTLDIRDVNKAVRSLANGGANTVVHGTTPPTETAVVEADLSLTDITTANVSTSAHGLTPKLDNVVTHFLNGQGGWTAAGGGAQTPWTANIDGGGFTLDDVSSITISNSTGDIGYTKFIRSRSLSAITNGPAVITYDLDLTNAALAASGSQFYSPALHFGGNGWKTTATAASQPVEFREYVVPVQGAANPTAQLTFDSAINGGAFGSPVTIDSSGNLQATTIGSGTSGVGFGIRSSGQVRSDNSLSTAFGILFGSSGSEPDRIGDNGGNSIRILNGGATAIFPLQYNAFATAKAANYTLVALDSGGDFNNNGASGSTTNTLPTAAVGMHFYFTTEAAQILAVVAVGSDTIRLAGTVSAAAGNIFSSAAIGNTIHLKCVKLTEWIIDQKQGTWTGPQ